MPSTVLVTGATGAIGPILVQHLLSQGFQVRALVRQPPLAGVLPAAVQLFLGDLTDIKALHTATTGAEVVFHLAAKLHINNPAPTLQAAYQQVNEEGTRCLIDVAQTTGVHRVVVFSSIAVYGPSQPGETFNEQTPVRPQTWYAQSKCQAEAIALSAKRGDTGEPLAVVLRLAAVYGARMKGNYARLAAALRKQRFISPGPGTNRRTLVYEQDVATAALLAAQHPHAGGQIYNVTDGDIHTFQDILSALCQALGRRPPRYHLPVAPMYFLASVLEKSFRWVGKEPPLGRATVQKILEDVAVSGDKLQRDLGFRPQFPLTRGWQETIGALYGT